jgi:hypothetical protein
MDPLGQIAQPRNLRRRCQVILPQCRPIGCFKASQAVQSHKELVARHLAAGPTTIEQPRTLRYGCCGVPFAVWSAPAQGIRYCEKREVQDEIGVGLGDIVREFGMATARLWPNSVISAGPVQR